MKTRLLSGNNSVVECDLAKVEVAGSNPVSRSTPKAAWPSGKATACKAVILRFKSGSRLHKKNKQESILIGSCFFMGEFHRLPLAIGDSGS